MTATPKLTHQTVRHAKPGRHADGSGLSLLVKATGARSWTLRVRVNGARRDIGLGGYPTVSLAAARERAAAIRADIGEGRDPKAVEHRPVVPTFADAAREVHRMNLPRWRNDHAAREWLASLERYAFPRFGKRPLDAITRADVLAVLTPIWTTKPETARRVRQRLGKVFAWGTAYGFIDLNPADAVRGALPSQPKLRNHQRALPYAEVPEALKLIDASKATPASKLCLRFVALTAARSGEARGATFDEIDLDAALWTVPARRMKAGVEHRVPLSRQALDVLIDAKALDDDSGLVFPSPLRPGEPLAAEGLLKVLATAGLDTSVHGFRSSFRTWALEQPGVAWATAEAALAHNLGTSVEKSYIRSDLLAERAALMAAWGGYAG